MRTKINFNEGWLFSKEAQNVETLDLTKFASVSVPHTWNNLDGQDGGGDYYRGTCWYYKKLGKVNKKENEVVYLEFEGVQSSFAMQSGRELRIMVVPEKISDAETYKLARDIKDRIETEMTYPGQIKVSVIRETRATEVAK
jgi:hypothetical protein